MRNFVFISPHFPDSYWKFCMALKQNIWDIVVLKNKNKNEFKGDFLWIIRL